MEMISLKLGGPERLSVMSHPIARDGRVVGERMDREGHLLNSVIIFLQRYRCDDLYMTK
jgi:hypothetical protein